MILLWLPLFHLPHSHWHRMARPAGPEGCAHQTASVAGIRHTGRGGSLRYQVFYLFFSPTSKAV